MGEPKFTKGPWTAVQSKRGIVDVNDTLGRDIVTTFGPNALVDAHLIAAAPELVEALRLLLQCPEIADCDPRDKDEETQIAERKARAALLKAQGQQTEVSE
jgi:hypothetical protein